MTGAGDTTNGRPPRAVVGSQTSYEEEMFGAAFDGVVLGRFWAFVRPYAPALAIALAAVLVFTATQLAIPLLIRLAIDHAIARGAPGLELLRTIALGFFGVLVVNYISNITQELLVGRCASNLLFDLRRAMFAHLQRVSLGFMDKTEVGRLMSRLQGDVNALQEFLETSIFAAGDLVLLAGIVTVRQRVRRYEQLSSSWSLPFTRFSTQIPSLSSFLFHRKAHGSHL